MTEDGWRDRLAAMRTKIDPAVLAFLDFCQEKLYVESLIAARRIGFAPMEAREAALRVVVAAAKAMAAEVQKIKNRETYGLSKN